MKYLYLPILAMLSLSACGNDEPDGGDSSGNTIATFDYKVLEYTPAPGQFVNTLPTPPAGGEAKAGVMAQAADDAMHSGSLVSLGAWGGYITVRLTAPIVNGDGADFRFHGNAFVSGVDATGAEYGNSEPGIVYVMSDSNGNGLPDDTWYELKGDGYDESIADYSVTYYRPQYGASDNEYIRWEASDGSGGYLNRVIDYHRQNFFAEWVGPDAQTFSGRRLPDNGRFDEATHTYRLYNRKGYADSYPTNNDNSWLDISSAVDVSGQAVSLTSIDFIRVVSGVLQTNGILGECSTEVGMLEVKA